MASFVLNIETLKSNNILHSILDTYGNLARLPGVADNNFLLKTGLTEIVTIMMNSESVAARSQAVKTLFQLASSQSRKLIGKLHRLQILDNLMVIIEEFNSGRMQFGHGKE